MNKNISDLLQSEAEYAENHDDVPMREGTINSHRGQRTRVFSIRLADSELVALEAAAEKAGLPASTLARTWIAARLAADNEAADVHDIADALATFSRRLAAL